MNQKEPPLSGFFYEPVAFDYRNSNNTYLYLD